MSKQFSFGSVPTIKARRTKFDMSYNVKTSMNVGTLYPIYIQEVVPGDTFKCNSSIVSRVTSSYLKPVMDNIYQDIYFFFVPSRICYDRWAEIFGENPRSAWANTEDVKAPRIKNYTVASGSVADYLGLPVLDTQTEWPANIYEGRFGVQAIPFRAFAKIYNDWFRDENNVDPVNILTGETTSVENLNANDWSVTNYTGKLPKVAKFHDYFTSCLPSPQKGDAVELALGTGFLPIRTNGNTMETVDPDTVNPYNSSIRFGFGAFSSGGTFVTQFTPDSNIVLGIGAQNKEVRPFAQAEGDWPFTQLNTSADYPMYLHYTNMGINADDLQAVSVNDLRYAFQLQKLLEKDARGGTRYVEYILSHFGVTSPDARLQNPEFLGGKRIPLNVQQVANTTSVAGTSTDVTGLGELGAYSLTNGNAGFSKGFTEHGFIIGVSCLRYRHSYQQGVERFWNRTKRTDFYDPVFANIGEQPVYKTELYFAEGMSSDSFDVPFGYNEAWADMRFRRNQITGQMRSGLENSLDVWHFGDNYSSTPTLSKSFIEETPIYVNRTLAVDSDVQDQFIVDIYHNVEAIREMPLYSIPGLIDHH